MSMFVKATPAPRAKSLQVKQISILYAVLLTGMVVAQLFTFDTFIALTASFELPIPGVLPYAIAPALVVFGVFALPFLLRMTVSPAFRVVSMLCSWLAALSWLVITVWLVTTRQVVETVGFLGTIGQLSPGWWAVLFSIALCIVAAWSSWGMWPLGRFKK